MVWFVLVWSIWKSRNDVTFNGVTKIAREVIEESIFLFEMVFG